MKINALNATTRIVKPAQHLDGDDSVSVWPPKEKFIVLLHQTQILEAIVLGNFWQFGSRFGQNFRHLEDVHVPQCFQRHFYCESIAFCTIGGKKTLLNLIACALLWGYKFSSSQLYWIYVLRSDLRYIVLPLEKREILLLNFFFTFHTQTEIT